MNNNVRNITFIDLLSLDSIYRLLDTIKKKNQRIRSFSHLLQSLGCCIAYYFYVIEIYNVLFFVVAVPVFIFQLC